MDGARTESQVSLGLALVEAAEQTRKHVVARLLVFPPGGAQLTLPRARKPTLPSNAVLGWFLQMKFLVCAAAAAAGFVPQSMQS